jgi:hypothetical protein
MPTNMMIRSTVHPVWNMKNEILRNRIMISNAQARRDKLAAATLKKENERIREEALKQFGVLIDY